MKNGLLPTAFWFLSLAACCAFSCREAGETTDGGVRRTTSAYFAPDPDYPERSLLPSPHILAINQDTNPPTLELKSSQCYAPGSITEKTLDGLEGLNGFSTFARGSILALFGAQLDGDSLAGKVLLVDLGTTGSDGSDADLENPLPVMMQLTEVPKYLNGCEAEPVMVPAAVILPMETTSGLPVVLKGDHHYGVALLDGILDDQELGVLPSYIWAMVRSKEESSDLTLLQLQLMHQPVLDALDLMGFQREEILLAWSFNTQYTDTALEDIGSRLGILGDSHDSTDVTIPATSLPVPPSPPQDFLAAIGLSCEAIGAGSTCPGIETLLSGQFVSPRFQQMAHIPPPYQALEDGRTWVPGTFDSELHPGVQGNEGETISFLASIPAGVSESYPVVIFQHPITPTDPVAAASANKMSMLSMANTLGGAGMAMVAIDGVLAGDRAVLVHDPVDAATELYPTLNTDVFVTRDNLRQTAVDLMQLVRVLKACRPETCGGLKVDTNRIYLLGTSLGAVTGSLAAAVSDGISRVVLNAPAAGLADLLAESPVLLSQLLPALCAGGIIGALCCSDSPPSCTPDDLASDPGFAQFKLSAQWVLDPSDPVNYAAKLGSKDVRLLLQQASGDQVFPNSAGFLLAGLLGLGENLVVYDPGNCGQVPGGAHSMLLSNCGLGTVNMRTDIVEFFLAP